jgi:hypothetical protein
VKLSRSALAFSVLAVWLWPGAGRAQLQSASEVPLEDVIEIQILGRDVYGFDALSTDRHPLRLALEEQVLWHQSQGRVGVVLTDRRALALSSERGGWNEAPLRLRESPRERGRIGDRIALVVTDQRLLGFDAETGRWVEQSIAIGESVSDVRIGRSTAVVVTDRNVYALSPDAGGFFGRSLRLNEEVESVRASATLATVSTSQRVLVFHSPLGRWTEEHRKLR